MPSSVLDATLLCVMQSCVTHTCAPLLRPKLGEAGGGEVAVEGKRLRNSQLPHQRKAACIDERVRPLVMDVEPPPCLVLKLNVDALDRQAVRPSHLEPRDREPVSDPAPQIRPGFAED